VKKIDVRFVATLVMMALSRKVTCASRKCMQMCSLCRTCLRGRLIRPWKQISGDWVYVDPEQCPRCRLGGAFSSLDNTDAAVVERDNMYRFDAASVGASYASTDHEQGDSEWEMNSEDG
jgi:hypothetical protein